MDSFKNCIPSPSEVANDSGVPLGMGTSKPELNGDAYGQSSEELIKGYSVDSYQEAGSELKLPVGRVPTKRYDA